MKNFFKGKAGTIIVIIFTLILAGIAVFTAIRLYQLRKVSVSPAAPSSQPRAQEPTACSLSFTLSASAPPSGTPTPTPSGTPVETPTGTPGPTPTNTPGQPNACGGTCGSNSNCQANYICSNGFCRNPSCPQSQNCVCAPGSTPTPPALPSSGTDWPTLAGAALGVFVILTSLMLAI